LSYLQYDRYRCCGQVIGARRLSDPDEDTQYEALSSLAKIDPKIALLIIDKNASSPEVSLRRMASHAASQAGALGLPIINKLTSDPEFGVAINAAFSLSRIGEAAIPTILEILKDSGRTPVHYALLNGLSFLGDRGKQLIEAIRAGKITLCDEAKVSFETWDSQKEEFRSAMSEGDINKLITRQEPVLSADATIEQEREEILVYADNILEEFKSKYSEIVGLCVLGSLSKGYWASGSDLDWGLVFYQENGVAVDQEKTEQIVKELRTRFANDQKVTLCQLDSSIDLSSLAPGQIKANTEIVFNGLFIGDREKLKHLRKLVLDHSTEEDWDMIRDEWDRNLNYNKAIDRFAIDRAKADEIVCLRKILWSLPEFEIAKKIFL